VPRRHQNKRKYGAGNLGFPTAKEFIRKTTRISGTRHQKRSPAMSKVENVDKEYRFVLGTELLASLGRPRVSGCSASTAEPKMTPF